MARPRKPTKLKELNGSAAVNPGRINKNEPKPTTPLGETPERFTALEREAWNDIVSTVVDGVAFDSDRIHIELTAMMLASIREAGGAPASAYAQISSMLAKLGMNPADRSKITIADESEEADPWAEFAE